MEEQSFKDIYEEFSSNGFKPLPSNAISGEDFEDLMRENSKNKEERRLKIGR